MSGWDFTEPAASVEESWQADSGGPAPWKAAPKSSNTTSDTGAGAGENDEWRPPDSNVSQHANAKDDGGCRVCHSLFHFTKDCPDKENAGAGGQGCFNCGEIGHNKADCTNPSVARALTGECFNCGEVGHNKIDCTNARVQRAFTGECHLCAQTGHRASECPSKPAEPCRACKQDGHVAVDCSMSKIHQLFTKLKIEDKSADVAWNALVLADQEKDIDDIKEAMFQYAKAQPGFTLQQIEKCFRESKMNIHLIAKRQEISEMHTAVDLQGNADMEFVVSFQFSAKPTRVKFAEGWPNDEEENMERLATAGFVMDRMVDLCNNCEQVGHKTRQCPEEPREREKLVAVCYNCDEEGHRARDCQQPRKVRGGGAKECRNCGERGHISKDCPSKEPDICRNCQEEGHRAKDCDKERVMKCRNCDGLGHTGKECPEPKDMSRVQCRNCDEHGHESRQCPQPTDWSRVECTTCHEKGHSYKRCTAQPAEEGGDDGW